jgi:hypothetical protein
MDDISLAGFAALFVAPQKTAGAEAAAPMIKPLHRNVALALAGWLGGHTLEKGFKDWKTGRQIRMAQSSGGWGG